MFKGVEKYSFKSTPMETPVATPISQPSKFDNDKIADKLVNFKL